MTGLFLFKFIQKLSIVIEVYAQTCGKNVKKY